MQANVDSLWKKGILKFWLSSLEYNVLKELLQQALYEALGISEALHVLKSSVQDVNNET